ncbi:MAG: BlaI/MecI/CopY family transcriptional regulator [Cyanobacteriota bacterium]
MNSSNTKLKGRLERLVLIAVRNLQRENDKYVTAKEVVDYLTENYEKKYFPQTITTVLKRLVSKKLLDKVTYGANRCAYFDQKLRSGQEGELIWEKFKEFADEFYFGNIELALNNLNKEASRRIKVLKAKQSPPSEKNN